MIPLFRILSAGPFAACSVIQPVAAAEQPREQLSLDSNWKFHLGDIPRDSFPGGQGVNLYGPDITYHGSKAGSAWGAAGRGYDDKSWKQVNLPHDWVVEQPFDEKALKQQGYRPRGIAWYRRTFKLPASDRGRNIELQFDGVATHCTVYFNGSEVHHNWSGYSSFYINPTPMARYGDDINTIAVRVDAEDTEGWWYEGGGIYRHTWLVKRSPVHVITDGVYANPVKAANGAWMIPAEVTLANTGAATTSASVDVGVFDAAGKRIAGARSTPVSIVPQGGAVAKVEVPVTAPQLWSVDKPNLYTVRTTVLSGDNKPVDSVDTTCGFRTIRFDVQKGFFLNDQPLKLQGTCNHQDHAGLGTAVPDSIWDFRVRKLKEMGSNAYRTAHNPPCKELLDACDRQGMLVMDETRHFNASTEYLKQLEWLVRRDRSHPSVILWSLFNEEGLEVNEEGMEIARTMNAVVKQLDTTRPTTGAQNKGQLGSDGKANPKNAAQVLDVVGINYETDEYDKIRAAYPDKPIVSTEDTSQVMTRGEYNTDWKKVVGSYDDVFPGWGATSNARNSWAAICKQSSFAGGFSWTGFAYRGEPTPYGWPSASSHFGALDLCGFPKTEFFVRQAMYVKDKAVLTLVPHWNWSGKDGQNIKVMALTNCDTVTLSLNGKRIDEKKIDPFQMVEWQVPYAPGKLEAVAKKGGREVAHFAVETTSEPVALRLTPDRKALAADGQDAVPVTIEAIDAKGRPVPTANLPVEFEISGPGANIGVGNGDPNSHDPEKGNKVKIYNGLAQIIVQSTRDAGDIKLTATAAGLAPTTLVLPTKPTAPRPFVP
ncbi:MAG: beta-galactosidase GalA [Luteolibacter sp.]